MPKNRETVLQFGTGRFLRSFVDLFVHESNRTSVSNLDVVAVQSTGTERARQLSAGPFHVAIRGISEGEPIDSVIEVHSVRQGLAAAEDWDNLVNLAQDRSVKVVVSNTTEAGLSLDPRDHERAGPSHSYPAKLLAILMRRFKAGLSGLTILPCELVDENGRVLRDLVLEQAMRWRIDGETVIWLREGNRWCNTLVDRIVSAPPDDHPMLSEDPLLSVAEPFALWAIETDGPLPIDHPAIQKVDDVTPFALRKVRILNGAHTALVERSLGRFATVREAMDDQDTRDWLGSVVRDEIVPCLEDRVEGASQFAADVFERFDNPFLDHRLQDIALHHEEKVKVRLLSTYADYKRQFGKPPTLLGQALENYL